MPKRSNEKRFKMNQQCREALAANICICGPYLTMTQLILLDDRLRIVVAPEKVRLRPRPEVDTLGPSRAQMLVCSSLA
jgi:hypothetical protein